MNQEKRMEFEKRIGYSFKDPELLVTALTHSSYSNEIRLKKQECNERLEFLGDAVLELISSEQIFRNHPDQPEGDLTRIRASYVCEPTLALCARERDSILSDAMEATIGAVYMDGGFESAQRYVEEFILKDIEKKSLFYDSKTYLQEIVQRDLKKLEYVLLKEEGPDHNKSFEVGVLIDGKQLTTAVGRTKKKAEQAAAYEAILLLEDKK